MLNDLKADPVWHPIQEVNGRRQAEILNELLDRNVVEPTPLPHEFDLNFPVRQSASLAKRREGAKEWTW